MDSACDNSLVQYARGQPDRRTSPKSIDDTPSFDWEVFLHEMETFDNKKLRLLIARSPVQIIRQLDQRQFTLLHHAALKGPPGKVKALLNLIVEIQHASETEIKFWIEQRTKDDAFTALHLAAFKGNMDAVEFLMEKGADPFAINFFGLNMLHVAA